MRQKEFYEENSQKQLSNSKSEPLNIPLYRVSFKTNHFEVSGQNLPKKGTLGTEFKKYYSWTQNQQPLIPLCTEFHFKQSTLKFCAQICPKKGILATDFKKTTIKFRIYTPEYSYVLSFILKKTLKFWDHICPKNVF